MTQPQTLNVEYQELTARADELETPMPPPPTVNPQAPCMLPIAITAASQLVLSADNMALYLSAFDQERQDLAESLRNAAKAYEEVDENAAAAIDSESEAVSAETFVPAAKNADPVVLADTSVAEGNAEELPYRDVKQAAQEISEPDQGVAFDTFAGEWIAYQQVLVQATYQFRPFQYWEGDAAYAVEDNFDQMRSWLYQMADLCVMLGTQAQDGASTQRWGVREHPTVEQIEALDEQWLYYAELNDPYFTPLSQAQIMEQYAAYQQKSEEVLADYQQKASLPLAPAQPPKPPTAYPIQEPGASGTVAPYDDLPWGNGLPDPTGMPTVPPTGMPDTSPTTDPVPTSPAAGAPGQPKNSGIKPASFGGGGMPSTPLKPWYSLADTNSASRPNSAAPAAGIGRGMPGSLAGSGAMGGGMGMGPMGAPGAQGHGAGKGKRVQPDGDAIYVERRAWTEAIIGLPPAPVRC